MSSLPQSGYCIFTQFPGKNSA